MLLKNLFFSKSSWWPGLRSEVRGFWWTCDFDLTWPRLISVSSEMLSITLESWIPSHRCLQTRHLFDKWRASKRSPCRCQPGLSDVYFSEGFFWSSGSASPAKIHPEEKFSLKKKESERAIEWNSCSRTNLTHQCDIMYMGWRVSEPGQQQNTDRQRVWRNINELEPPVIRPPAHRYRF